MNYNPSETEFACRIISATPEDVSQAYYDLKRDMNPDFVHVFLDKIQRYALKPDRALFLATHQHTFIAFGTIINHSPPPENINKSTTHIINGYACATGLMVLPEYRKKGVASQIIEQWEQWARRKNLPGIWLITRQMSDWYQRSFHYSIQGTTLRNGVKKTILTKHL